MAVLAGVCIGQTHHHAGRDSICAQDRGKHCRLSATLNPFRSSDLGQWVMIDPTYRLMLRDQNGSYLSIPQVRDALVSGQVLVANETAGHNRAPFSMEYYRAYMTKNMFRFSSHFLKRLFAIPQMSRIGMAETQDRLYPAPVSANSKDSAYDGAISADADFLPVLRWKRQVGYRMQKLQWKWLQNRTIL